MTGLNEISIDELVKRIEIRIGSHDLISDDLFSQLRTRHRLLMDVVEASQDLPKLLQYLMWSYADTECDPEQVAEARNYISKHGGMLSVLATHRGSLMKPLAQITWTEPKEGGG
jgi:hypothetical protein